MNDLETRFRNTSPEIESLPNAQRSLAARLAGQVNVMQSARKNYTEAIQAQDADANARLKELQAQAVSLESEIAVRRKDLSAEQQKKLTEQQVEGLHKKQAELAEAEKAERAAREAYRQKIRDYDQLAERDRAFQSTREELQRIMQKRAQANAQRAADTAVAPLPPEQPKILEIQDNRALYSTGAGLIVGLVFGALIFLSLHFEPRHRHDAAAGR